MLLAWKLHLCCMGVQMQTPDSPAWHMHLYSGLVVIPAIHAEAVRK
jgi:hypothetical protein